LKFTDRRYNWYIGAVAACRRSAGHKTVCRAILTSLNIISVFIIKFIVDESQFVCLSLVSSFYLSVHYLDVVWLSVQLIDS